MLTISAEWSPKGDDDSGIGAVRLHSSVSSDAEVPAAVQRLMKILSASCNDASGRVGTYAIDQAVIKRLEKYRDAQTDPVRKQVVLELIKRAVEEADLPF